MEAGEVLRVKASGVEFGARSVVFFARLQKGGRITVPRVEAEILEVKPGTVLKVGLLVEKTNKKQSNLKELVISNSHSLPKSFAISNG